MQPRDRRFRVWHEVCLFTPFALAVWPLIRPSFPGDPSVPRPLLHQVAEEIKSRRRFSKVNELFRRFAQGASRGFGSPWMFILATVICLAWIITGPIYNYSENWQFFINDLTNVVTFLAVFLIQNTQNRDAKAIHLKLDELLRAVEGARTHLVDIEDLSDDELDYLQQQFKRLREREIAKAEQVPAAESASGEPIDACVARASTP